MCTGAESRGIVDGNNPVTNSKVGGVYHEINGMRSTEGGDGEGKRNSGCSGRFIQGLHQHLHQLLKALFPTLSLSEVRNYISSFLCVVFVLKVLFGSKSENKSNRLILSMLYGKKL